MKARIIRLPKVKAALLIAMTIVLMLGLLQAVPAEWLSGKGEVAAASQGMLVPAAGDVRVLEIQPDYTSTVTARDTTLPARLAAALGVDVNRIKRTTISMKQFIGQVDDLNGQYDVIYIGRRVISANEYDWTRMASNKRSVQIDYSAVGAVFATNGGTANITRPGANIDRGEKNQVGIHARVGVHAHEFVPGNDITKRRAEVLEAFMQSGQLVIYQDTILNNDLANTILYEVINGNRNLPNVIEDASGGAGFAEGIAEFSSGKWSRRPEVVIYSQPKAYDGKTSSYIEEKLLSVTFDATNRESKNMVARLYVDFNGDGLYTDNEVVAKIDNMRSSTGFDYSQSYTLSYVISDHFTGVHPWRLEVEIITGTDLEGAKTYYTGYAAFEGPKLNIRVLQLQPETGRVFNIKNDMASMLSTDQYNITVDVMTTFEFDQSYNSHPASVPIPLNGRYDMVIFGFGDSYLGTTARPADLTNAAALKELEDFIESGQSVMFTHDTITAFIGEARNGGAELTASFRSLVGQNIFNTYSFAEKTADNRVPAGLSQDVPSELNQSRLDRWLDTRGNASVGVSLFQMSKMNISGSNFELNRAYKINDALITMYPFVLDEELPVATTHNQYFQLDLEDPDVVPIYNLNYTNNYNNTNGNTPFSRYDSANSFYTYTKGSITFSGTGHSYPGGVHEQRLFVNTMLKASRGANHAPTLEVYDITDGYNVNPAQNTLTFSYIADDIDHDDEFLDARVEVLSSADRVLHYIDMKQIRTGARIPVENLNISAVTGTEFKIRVTVWDDQGATASRTINLTRLDVPSLLISVPTVGYLVGDDIPLTYNLTPDPRAATSAVLRNLTLQTTTNEANLERLSGNWSSHAGEGASVLRYNGTLADIHYVPGTTPVPASAALTLKAKVPGTSNLIATASWTYNNSAYSANVPYSIQVREGEVYTSFKNALGMNIHGVEFTLQKKNGTSWETVLSETSGNNSIGRRGLASGTYRYTISEPDGYDLAGNGLPLTGEFELNFESNVKTLDFTFQPESAIDRVRLSSLQTERPQEANANFVGETALRLSFTMKHPFSNLDLKDVLRAASNPAIQQFTYEITAATGNGSDVFSQINDTDQLLPAGDYVITYKVTARYASNVNRPPSYDVMVNSLTYQLKIGDNEHLEEMSYHLSVPAANQQVKVSLTAPRLY